MVLPDSTVVAMKAGRVMTIRLDELKLGDLVLGFDVKLQQPVFSKLILWADVNYTSSTR